MDMRIYQEHREETVIQKSRFIACTTRASNEEEAKAYIQSIRKEYPDATHVCTAYVLGKDKTIMRSNDNGEPSGTAGVPILEAILHTDIYDVVVCVVRYFGGTKLGAGGLIRAYAGATTTVLSNAQKTEDVLLSQYQLTYPYDLSGSLEGWLRNNTQVVEFQYDEQVTCIFETDDASIKEKIQNLTSGQVQPLFLKEVIEERLIL